MIFIYLFIIIYHNINNIHKFSHIIIIYHNINNINISLISLLHIIISMIFIYLLIIACHNASDIHIFSHIIIMHYNIIDIHISSYISKCQWYLHILSQLHINISTILINSLARIVVMHLWSDVFFLDRNNFHFLWELHHFIYFLNLHDSFDQYYLPTLSINQSMIASLSSHDILSTHDSSSLHHSIIISTTFTHSLISSLYIIIPTIFIYPFTIIYHNIDNIHKFSHIIIAHHNTSIRTYLLILSLCIIMSMIFIYPLIIAYHNINNIHKFFYIAS